MPTLTIDLPDSVNVSYARTFVLEKLHEAGFFPSDKSEQTVEDEVDDDPDSWFTPEMRRKAKENRRHWEEEARKNPRTEEDRARLHRILLNFPVADEEAIKMQDEASDHLRQWKIPEY